MANRIAQIPAFLAVIQNVPSEAPERERQFAAICAMLQRFSLLAWEQRIGLVWNTDEVLHKPSFEAGMGLREKERVVCILYMGHFEKMPKPKTRTPAANKLVFL